MVRIVDKRGVSTTEAEILSSVGSYAERDVIYCADTKKTYIVIDGAWTQLKDSTDNVLSPLVTGNKKMAYDDYNVAVQTGSSEVIITLPDADLAYYTENGITSSKLYSIYKTDTGSGSVKIVPPTGKVIGEDYIYLTQKDENITIYFNTINWIER
jgi:hypothetical protein